MKHASVVTSCCVVTLILIVDSSPFYSGGCKVNAFLVPLSSKTTTHGTVLFSGAFRNNNNNNNNGPRVGVRENNPNPFENVNMPFENVNLDPFASDETSAMVPFSSYETTGGARDDNGGGGGGQQHMQQQQQDSRSWYEPYGQGRAPRYAHQQRIQDQQDQLGAGQGGGRWYDPYQPSASRQHHPAYQQKEQLMQQGRNSPTHQQQQSFYEPYRPNFNYGGQRNYQPGIGGNYRNQQQQQSRDPYQQQQQPWHEQNRRTGTSWWQNSVSSTNGLIQGNSRKTYSSSWGGYGDGSSDVILQSQDPYTPIDAKVNIWNGPDNTARQMKVYSEDGFLRPLRVNFKNYNPTLYSNTVDVQNTGPLEFPMSAHVETSTGSAHEPQLRQNGNGVYAPPGRMKTIQGKSILTQTFTNPQVQNIQVDIETDGMPCYVKVEVLQGPGEARQKFKVYTDDGSGFQGIIEIPYGYANCGSCTIIVTNEGPLEFPIKCSLQEL
mmetsp:Transcript_19895/g.28168  ORF Transcript_19895/g.28168 Transcript_19895/m.28168 type:complete len:491 (+) Transcript_19895:132-1604(+)